MPGSFGSCCRRAGAVCDRSHREPCCRTDRSGTAKREQAKARLAAQPGTRGQEFHAILFLVRRSIMASPVPADTLFIRMKKRSTAPANTTGEQVRCQRQSAITTHGSDCGSWHQPSARRPHRQCCDREDAETHVRSVSSKRRVRQGTCCRRC